MSNNQNKKILQEFLDAFCIRCDQIPTFSNTQGEPKFLETNIIQREMTYITHEDYLNFNVNGVTYLTRDCEDVRTYLESLGYEEGNKEVIINNEIEIVNRVWHSTVMAAWYDVGKMTLYYPVDSHIFRLFLALSYTFDVSPTLTQSNIGKNEDEIKATIIRAYSEEPAFNDELWKQSDTRKYFLKKADYLNFVTALSFIRDCITQLGYMNVYIPNILENPEDIEKIINFWKLANGQNDNYTLTNEFIQDIPNMINEYNTKNNVTNSNHKIIIDLDNNRNMLLRPTSICQSEEELWDSLYKLINYQPKSL